MAFSAATLDDQPTFLTRYLWLGQGVRQLRSIGRLGQLPIIAFARIHTEVDPDSGTTGTGFLVGSAAVPIF